MVPYTSVTLQRVAHTHTKETYSISCSHSHVLPESWKEGIPQGGKCWKAVGLLSGKHWYLDENFKNWREITLFHIHQNMTALRTI